MPESDSVNGLEISNDPQRAWNDRVVLEGVRRRDSDALARFFDVTFPYVYSVAFRLLGSREAAEDATQEVFLKIYQAADRLDANRHPKPWITTITYNACRDAARRSGARPEDPTDAMEIGERKEGPGNPEAELAAKERDMMIDKALLALDEDWRIVVVLHDYCDFPHDEIARLIGVSHAAARKRYSRALKRLAELLRGYVQ